MKFYKEEDVLADLTCPLCSKLLEDPRLLPCCSLTVCAACIGIELSLSVTEKGQIACSLCGDKYARPPKGFMPDKRIARVLTIKPSDLIQCSQVKELKQRLEEMSKYAARILGPEQPACIFIKETEAAEHALAHLDNLGDDETDKRTGLVEAVQRFCEEKRAYLAGIIEVNEACAAESITLVYGFRELLAELRRFERELERYIFVPSELLETEEVPLSCWDVSKTRRETRMQNRRRHLLSAKPNKGK